ncbi:MAG: hypothetical protein LUB61_07975, partial [Eggerthellaceae bacterium]|nr:hypothetical protein [Eggerthellaceae bacterium]
MTSTEAAQREIKDGISESICEYLADQGYETRKNVGRSSFKVDVGVVDPRDDGRYLAAILLDGESYELAQTTRDREISQPGLLTKLGWNVYRVWSIDWWENKNAVKEDISKFLENMIKKPLPQPVKIKEAPEKPEAPSADGVSGNEAAVMEMPDLEPQSPVLEIPDEMVAVQTPAPFEEEEPEEEPEQELTQEPVHLETEPSEKETPPQFVPEPERIIQDNGEGGQEVQPPAPVPPETVYSSSAVSYEETVSE